MSSRLNQAEKHSCKLLNYRLFKKIALTNALLGDAAGSSEIIMIFITKRSIFKFSKQSTNGLYSLELEGENFSELDWF